MIRVHFIFEENPIMFMWKSERRDLEIFRSYGLVVLADEAQDAPEADVNAHNRGCGRRSQDLMDFKLVKSWLPSCEKRYQLCREALSPISLPLSVRFIDVNEYGIVPGHLGKRYIALSYVWGKTTQLSVLESNLEQLMGPDGLRHHTLGCTIVDAVTVCKAVGEQVLWVDSLCIIQNNLEEKSSMIARRNKIYKNAVLTLINACTGESDANSSLLGVSVGLVKSAQLSKLLVTSDI
jgi:hypothetical protein